jgi:drug/metabolite transporter (DMT)-like permease
MSYKQSGVLMVILGNVLFSAKAIFAKLIFQYDVDATTLMTLRLAFSLPCFGIAAWWALRRREEKLHLKAKDWQKMSFFAFTGYYAASFLNFVGLKTVSAGIERLILFTYPTIVVLLLAVIHKTPVSRKQIWALIATYGGILLVVVPHLQDAREVGVGALFVLASSISFAVYLIFVGDYISKLGSILFTSIVMILAGIMTFTHFLVFRPLTMLIQPWEVYALFAGLAFFSTVIPIFLISEGIRRLGAGNTSIIASIGPVATIGLAYVFLNEPVTTIQLAGTALVLFGVWLVGIRKDRPLTDTPVRVR